MPRRALSTTWFIFDLTRESPVLIHAAKQNENPRRPPSRRPAANMVHPRRQFP